MITSRSNPQVRNVIQLKKKAKERDAQGVFFTEGIKMLREAPADRVQMVYISQSFAGKTDVRKELGKLPWEEVSDEVFACMTDTKTPQGVLCVLRQFSWRPEDLLRPAPRADEKCAPPLLLALETLQDPGNLGTIVRMAEGAGVCGILMSRDCVDIYNPKVIRSTMGSIYRMPFCYVEDFGSELAAWKRAGVRLYAAHLDGRRSYDREDYTGASAFLIGNESRGLSREIAAMADHLIRIPMLGQVESLNAAVAASVLAYEAARQRRFLQ